MLQKTYPYYLGNEPVNPNHDLPVTDKYSGEVATRAAGRRAWRTPSASPPRRRCASAAR
jgi:hypothetical protein